MVSSWLWAMEGPGLLRGRWHVARLEKSGLDDCIPLSVAKENIPWLFFKASSLRRWTAAFLSLVAFNNCWKRWLSRPMPRASRFLCPSGFG